MNARGIAGFLFLLLSGVLLGFRAKRRVLRRAASLRGIAVACAMMESEISFARTPPAELTRKLAAQGNEAGVFFKGVCGGISAGLSPWEAWRAELKNAGETLGMNAAEAAELEAVGRALTCLNSEAAQKSMAASAETFRVWADTAEREQKNEAKLKQTLWVTAALLTGILLL